MLCNGLSLPALMHLMGHSKIQTTMVYVQLTAEDVYQQYAHAVAQHIRLHSFCSVMRHHRPLHSSIGTTVCSVRRNLSPLRSAMQPEGSTRAPSAASCVTWRRITPRSPGSSNCNAIRTFWAGWRIYAPILHHLAKITIAIRVTFLHRMLEDLAWSQQIPTLAHLLSRADVPRRE